MRKQLLLAIGLLILSCGGHAQYDGAPMAKPQTKKDTVKEMRRDKYPHSDNDWENFDVLHINRLPSAATFLSFPSREMALKGNKSASPYYACLNGIWKFKYVPTVGERSTEFWKEGFDVSDWADIKVPVIGNCKDSGIHSMWVVVTVLRRILH